MNMPTRETSTILAALRYWQIRCEGREPTIAEYRTCVSDIACHGRTMDKLNSKEIDALCEHLNFDDLAEPPAPSESEAKLIQKYRAAANEIVAKTHGLSIDADPKVSMGGDPGAYVQCWLWVDNDEAGIDPGEDRKP